MTTIPRLTLIGEDYTRQLFDTRHFPVTGKKLLELRGCEIRDQNDGSFPPHYPLFGTALEVERMIEDEWAPYAELIETALRRSPIPPAFPANPPTVVEEWCKYDYDKEDWVVIDPDDLPTFMVWDVETVMCGGYSHVITAGAFDGYHWYYFQRKWRANPSPSQGLVSLGSGGRLIVGHNHNYDRSHILEEYYTEDVGNDFMCTLSMADCIYAMSNQQQTMYKAFNAKGRGIPKWAMRASELSLKAIAKKELGIDLGKGQRDAIIDQTWQSWPSQLDMKATYRYNMEDVRTTFLIFKQLYGKLKANYFSSDITWYGMLKLAKNWIPLDENWHKFLEDADKCAEDIVLWFRQEFYEEARQLTFGGFEQGTQGHVEYVNSKIRTDYEFDWTPAKNGKNKGLPAWFRKYTAKQKGVVHGKITRGSKVTCSLARFAIGGWPVEFRNHFIFKGKVFDSITQALQLAGCYEEAIAYLKEEYDYDLTDQQWIPKTMQVNLLEQEWCEVKTKEGTWYKILGDGQVLQVEHPSSTNPLDNVGSIVSKDFAEQEKAGAIECLSRFDAEDIYDKSLSVANWISLKKRANRVRVFHNDDCFVTIPQGVVSGTQTRRMRDSLWLVAPNQKSTRIGTEFMGMIKSPDGYKLVHADFDSLQAWIAATLGDKQYAYEKNLWPAYPGSYVWALSVMAGSKDLGTDVHTLTATAAGIDRGPAKNCNFAMIFGSGKNKLALMLMLASKKLVAELREKHPDWPAEKIFARVQEQCEKMAHDVVTYNKGQKQGGRVRYWYGGIASPYYRALDSLSATVDVRTPFLGVKLPDCINPRYCEPSDFFTTRSNWLVQSAEVDLLHILVSLVCIIAKREKIKGFRVVLTIHDCAIFLCEDSETEKLAEIMQTCHLYSKAIVYRRMGFDTVPNGTAWYSGVEIDTRFRKSIGDPYITPSNPRGFADSDFVGFAKKYAAYYDIGKNNEVIWKS